MLRIILAAALVGMGVARPADWRPGERSIIPPSLSTADSRLKFPRGWDERRPHLHFVEAG